MTQTTNYQLNQWEATDQVKRTDFNADNAKIDAAIHGLAAGKADAAAVAALQAQVAAKCEIVTGTYVGNNAAQREIYLGRKPKAVLLFAREGMTYGNSFNYGGLAFPDAPAYRGDDTTKCVLTVTNTGFTVYYNRGTSSGIASNASTITYYYIAFF